jgi:hypothetical protein
VDTNWYTDTGKTDITSQLDKLTTKEKIQTASGSSMGIDYIGNSILHTPTHDLCLNKVLHIPITQKNLVSIHRLTTDNLIFIEYHSRYFLIKDRVTRKVLLQGRCRGGIYPWSSLECSSSKCVFLAAKPLLGCSFSAHIGTTGLAFASSPLRHSGRRHRATAGSQSIEHSSILARVN